MHTRSFRLYGTLLSLLFLATTISCQQITDIYETTWNRTSLLKQVSPRRPIRFGQPGPIGLSDIVVDDSQVYQQIDGYGATLTDYSALTLFQLKRKNLGNYHTVLNKLFNPADGVATAALSYLQVTLGASDFSAKVYSYDDTPGDVHLRHFSVDRAPSYLWSTLRDIQSVNKVVKFHFVPWSPPGWMKDSGTMLGGSFKPEYVNTYAQYLLKSLQGIRLKGIHMFAISVQNEPRNQNPTYPTALFDASTEAAVAKELRRLLDKNGFSSVRIVGYEHNWDNVEYPEQLLEEASSSFDGVAFHCYGGVPSAMTTVHDRFPNEPIRLTECTGTIGSNWWGDVKWHTDNLYIGGANNWAQTALLWNIALDARGEPRLPGTDSCKDGCRPIVVVNADGSYEFQQEYYGLAHIARATVPRDVGGPFAKRIKTTVGGTLYWALLTAGFVTERARHGDQLRYSLDVLNWYDTPNGTANPTAIDATIEFRGKQATVTFPVGLTTLSWYASAPFGGGHNERDVEIEMDVDENVDVTEHAARLRRRHHH